ncbi:MAG: alpha-L-rhamnosidase C-terminal domain-containing protein [Bacteroidota bacterium]
MKNSLIRLLFLTLGFMVLRSTDLQAKVRGDAHPIKRSYLSPVRILWQSEEAEILNSQRLLEPGSHQASTVNEGLCTLKNKGGKAAILLDFGKELHGGLELVTGAWPGKRPIKVRVRFGESVSEALAEIGEESGATNDHAIRDWQVQLPWIGKIEIGNTGFRFVHLELLDDDATLHLREVSAISIMRDIPYLGSFNSSDPRLNQIWATGAYTVHLNMQEYLWDGIKRDRLVWVGDMHPEVMTILSVFGANEVVPKSLDFIADLTPPDRWMNGISSYSMWWVLIQHQYYLHTGQFDYLQKHQGYIFQLLAKLKAEVAPNGKEQLSGNRFLDWPTSEDSAAVHVGLQSLMVMTFEVGVKLARVLGQEGKTAECQAVLNQLKSYRPELPHRKSPGALMALAGLSDAKTVNQQLLSKGGVQDISTFYGYYVLNAMAQAGDYEQAMSFISEYWGAMLDLGATTFWEDFNMDWVDRAGRIDELPTEGKVDIHRTYGDYCYQGNRHSFCHGWASGPTAWLSEYVLGIKVLAPGCKKVAIEPHLGNLDWVEGSYPTPLGLIKVRHEKLANGEIRSDIDAPDGMEIQGQNKPSPRINPPAGRVAIVADGNSPDPDDLGGTAVSIALLRAAGLASRLVHYSHSCDLVRGPRISARAEKERHALMQASCEMTARRWGGFEALTFWDAKWQTDETVQDLVNAIEASTAEDPLWIIEAGEPDIIGLALDASAKEKHPYVKVLTHHPANDNAGDFYTWQQILDYGVEEVRIPDQNTHLKVDMERWEWARTHPDSRIQQVWLQGKIAEVDDVVNFQKGKWDCSDAGMVLYWITGATQGGLAAGKVNDVKALLLDFIEQTPEK